MPAPTFEDLVAEMSSGGLVQQARERKITLKVGLSEMLTRFRQMLTKHGCENSDKLMMAAKVAYDNLCNAIDIPYVPEIIEGQIEAAIWNGFFSPALKKIVEKICKS